MIDDVDQRFRKPKRPELVLEPHQAGQDCPNPNCPGRLAWHGVCDQAETGGHYLACDDPGCGWREPGGKT